MPKVFIVLLALICLSGCGWNPLGSKTEYVRRGRDFAAQGKLDDAAFQYRKALQKDPKYGEAWLRYGQLLASQNKTAEAFSSLSRATELLPASEHGLVQEARVALGRTAISALLGDPRRPQQLYQTAGKMATDLLGANPKSFEGLRLKGYLAIVDSKPKDAIRYFQEALASNPNLPDVVTVLTQTLLSDNQDAEAETTAHNGLATFRNYGPLYDTLYGYYITHNRAAEAEQLLRSKVANNPKDAFFVIQLADHLQSQKKPQQVDDLLRAFVANASDFPTAPLDAGDFYRRTGNPEEAIRLYQLGLEPSRQRKPDKTKDYLQRIVAVRLAQGHTQEAFDATEALLKQFPDDVDAIASRADLRMASGKPEEMQKAVVELAALVKKAPDRADIRETLARVYRQLGRDQEAQKSFEEVLQRDPKNRDALREMADISIRARKPDEALTYAERLLAIDPKNTGARLVRTAAWALRGRFAEVRAELHRLTTENPNLAEAWLQTATLDVETKNYAEAEQIFRRLDQPGKGDLRASKGLVFVFMAQGQPQKALAVARQDAARSGQPEVRTLLATTAAQTGDLDLALSTSQKLVSDFPDDPDRLIFVGEIYQRKGQLDQAIAAFQAAQAKAPGDPAPGSYLANVLEQSGRFDEAVEVSRKNLKLRPDDPFLMNALAWHLALAGKNLDEATTLAQHALQKQPANGAFADTEGMVSLKSGKLDDALRTFQQLVLKEGNVASYRTHLAAVLIQRGDRQRARTELETALRNHPSPLEEEEIRKLLKNAS
jgi:tetratricopeptide (TPR) repeat protein